MNLNSAFPIIIILAFDIISNNDIVTVGIIIFLGFLGFVARNISESNSITKSQYIKNLITTIIGVIALGFFCIGFNVPNPVSFGVGIVAGWIGGNVINALSNKVLKKIDEK